MISPFYYKLLLIIPIYRDCCIIKNTRSYRLIKRVNGKTIALKEQPDILSCLKAKPSKIIVYPDLFDNTMNALEKRWDKNGSN